MSLLAQLYAKIPTGSEEDVDEPQATEHPGAATQHLLQVPTTQENVEGPSVQHLWMLCATEGPGPH